MYLKLKAPWLQGIRFVVKALASGFPLAIEHFCESLGWLSKNLNLSLGTWNWGGLVFLWVYRKSLQKQFEIVSLVYFCSLSIYRSSFYYFCFGFCVGFALSLLHA